jgi:NADH dehydrogenase
MNPTQTNPQRPRVLIIGGGFGGIEVAKTLRNSPVEVLMLDKHNHHTFQPLLYQVATGSLEAPSVAFPLRKMFRRQDNFNFRLAEVLQIDAEAKQVYTDIGPFAYDYLVVATGATTNFFGNKDLEYYTLPMKNLKEAVNIRSFILQNIEASVLEASYEDRIPYLNFVIVGGGPTGVELSGAIAEIRNNILANDYPELKKEDMVVSLVEGQGRVLANLSTQASEKAALYLHELGVQIRLNVQVTSYDGEQIQFANGDKIDSKTVIWSAGVRGLFPEGLAEAHIQRGNRIEIDQSCQVKGYSSIFAIGDVAAMVTPEYPNGHPGVAPAAQQQGKFVGKQIINLLNGHQLNTFTYFDKGSMATIGRNKAVVDLGKLRFQGFFAWWVWMFVHLMSLIGFRNRLVTFVNWMISYITFNGGVRLIIHRFTRPPRPISNEPPVQP